MDLFQTLMSTGSLTAREAQEMADRAKDPEKREGLIAHFEELEARTIKLLEKMEKNPGPANQPSMHRLSRSLGAYRRVLEVLV